ncbi:MAG: Arc family DNA-binding protein [Candidatus Dormibacteria bacterium]
MKQLLLRLPEEVHYRLAARAKRAGQSINSVATEILDASLDSDTAGRQERLRARARALGVLREGSSVTVSPARRRRILGTMRGLGPVADRLLMEERERP